MLDFDHEIIADVSIADESHEFAAYASFAASRGTAWRPSGDVFARNGLS